MINIIFYFPDGHTEVEPDVHPRSQHEAMPIPAGAEALSIYLATESGVPIVAVLGPDGRDTGRTLIGDREVAAPDAPAAPVGWGPEMGG